MLKNISGQFLHFALVNLSGAVQTGASGQISGRKIPDTNPMAVLSGNIVETSGGMYRANLFDWDTSGDYIGYLFTASGCIPRSFSIVTEAAYSGRIYPASGVNATVPAASISGVTANSGINATVPIATISGLNAVVPTANLSGVVANSGLNVTVPIATISGVNAIAESGTVFPASGITAPLPSTNEGTARSGTVSTIQFSTTAISGANFYRDQLVHLRTGTGAEQARTIVAFDGDTKIATIAPDWEISPSTDTVYEVLPQGRQSVLSGQTPASLSGIVANSGLNVTVPIATISGTNTVVPTATLSGVVANSGLNVTVPIATISGVNAGTVHAMRSGQLSGHVIDLLSGRSYTASGIFATATATVESGSLYLASGHFGFQTGSGLLQIASGPFVNATTTINSGEIYLASGHFGYHSGLMQIASGPNTVVPPATLSGVTVNSGLNVTVPIATVSGLNAVVPTATLSGVVANSGLNVTVPSASISGAHATVPTATLSGVVANSGLNVTVPVASISGTRVVIGSGQLSGHVFENVPVETSLDAVQAMRAIAAATAGQLSGAGTTTVNIAGAGVGGTNRIQATVNASGDRTSITLNL